MTEFYINNYEDVKLFKAYKAFVSGTQPFSIQKTFKEKIKDKLDEGLKSMEALYDSSMNYVDSETKDSYYEAKQEKLKEKIEEANQQRSEALKHPESTEEVAYSYFFEKEISRLQRELVKVSVDRAKPNEVSSFVLPKMVVMQLAKNTASKWEKVEKVTDDTLLTFVDKLDKSQLGKLRRIIQERIDEKTTLDPDDPMNQPPAPLLEEMQDDDLLVENVEPVRNGGMKR